MNDTNHKRLSDSQLTATLVAILVTSSLFAPTIALAQAWTISPDLRLDFVFDDNARLRADEALQDEISGGELDARVRFARTSPTGSIMFMPRLRTDRYSSDEEFDSDDYSAIFSGQHRTQKTTWSLSARYSNEEVRVAELEDPDFDNPDIDRPITDDSGISQVRDQRVRSTISPTVRLNISPKSQIEFAADYTDTSYDENAGGLEDYRFTNLEVNLIRQLTQQNLLSVGIFGNRFDVEDDSFTSDSGGLTARFTRQFSPRFSGFVSAGLQKIDSDFFTAGSPDKSSDNTFLAAAGFTRQYEITRIIMDISHNVNPSGIGFLTERTQIRANLSRRLSPLITGTVDIRFLKENTVPDSQTRPDRDFGQIRLGLTWPLSRNWSLIAAYTHRRQKFATGTDEATANLASLGIRYSPPRRN